MQYTLQELIEMPLEKRLIVIEQEMYRQGAEKQDYAQGCEFPAKETRSVFSGSTASIA